MLAGTRAVTVSAAIHLDSPHRVSATGEIRFARYSKSSSERQSTGTIGDVGGGGAAEKCRPDGTIKGDRHEALRRGPII